MASFLSRLLGIRTSPLHHVRGIPVVLDNSRPDISSEAVLARLDEALALVERLQPDVLLLDMNMPQTSGLDVARALAGQPDAPKMLALSAFNDSATILGLLDAGAAGYITKDQHPTAVREAVLAVHRGEGRWFVPIPRRPDALSPLTGREHEVLVLMARGLDNSGIGDRLRIAENTVRNHLASVYSKLGVGSAREAIAWAWENGLVRTEG